LSCLVWLRCFLFSLVKKKSKQTNKQKLWVLRHLFSVHGTDATSPRCVLILPLHFTPCFVAAFGFTAVFLFVQLDDII
jgi:hypothetical protein